MKDKEFLERIEMAYNVFKKQNVSSNDIEQFIAWLYTQYGYIQDKKYK